MKAEEKYSANKGVDCANCGRASGHEPIKFCSEKCEEEYKKSINLDVAEAFASEMLGEFKKLWESLGIDMPMTQFLQKRLDENKAYWNTIHHKLKHIK